MIISHISKLIEYIPKYKSEIQAFLGNVNPGTKDGEYPIVGDEIFARVQSYDLRTPEQGRVEAHDKYIDIQSVIVGAEGIDVFRREILTAETEYDALNDVSFYTPGERFAAIELPAGYFTMLFPDEAHRPQMLALGQTHVKKFVIKYGVYL